jgi:hypothetical protein
VSGRQNIAPESFPVLCHYSVLEKVAKQGNGKSLG